MDSIGVSGVHKRISASVSEYLKSVTRERGVEYNQYQCGCVQHGSTDSEGGNLP